MSSPRANSRRAAAAAAAAAAAVKLGQILDTLQAHYGELSPHWPTDPYEFLLWWHCGYPPSDERCARGWQALTGTFGTTPEKLLAATPARLAQALKSGGMVSELRATRIETIARVVCDEYAGDLRAALAPLSVRKAQAALRRFPGIGVPGAERILLFSGLAAVAAVPSACPFVLTRIAEGREAQDYRATYVRAQQLIEEQVPASLAARMRAYLLVQRHGRELCKRTNPRCELCPVAGACAYFARRKRTAARAPRRVTRSAR
jgi:endonuclease III